MKKSLVAAIVITTFAALTDLRGEAITSKCTINIPGSVIQVLKQKLSDEIPVLMKGNKIPGCAVALVSKNRVLWHGEYGYTDRSKTNKVTEKTLFCLMSCSKSITALGVLTGVKEGLLSLDEPVSLYIPGMKFLSEFEGHPENRITLRHLLSHRAGFENDVNCAEFGLRPHEISEYIDKIPGVWMNFPVGYQDYYSNIGPEVAGYILEKQSGMPFSDYMQKKVFIPLGMNNSTYDQEVVDNITDRACGSWAAESERNVRPPAYIPMLACGGAFSNLKDMTRYVQFHLGANKSGSGVPDPGVMHKISFPVKGQKGGYTPGLERYPLGNSYYLFQEGGGYGFESAIIIYPECDLGFVILTNSCWTRLNGSTMADLINSIIGPLYGTREDGHPEKYTGEYKKLDNNDTIIRKVLGIYDNDKKIYRHNDSIFFEDPGGIYLLDFYSDNGALVAAYGDYREIRFLPELRGRPGNIQIIDFNTGMTGYAYFNKPLPEYDRQGPGKAGWESLTGRYNLYIDGLFRGRFMVTLDNGYITVNGSRCHEFRPGMFFNNEGSVFDFTGQEPSVAGFLLTKQKE